jgi:RNA polymerase sigma-70 factor, ECF subfamily
MSTLDGMTTTMRLAAPYDARRDATDDAASDFATKAGFRRVWQAYEAEMRSFAARRLSDRGRAEDAVQEAFLRAWRHARGYDARRGTPRSWLFAILRNVIIDQARAQSARPTTTNATVEGVTADDDDSRIAALVVGEALQRLSRDHREAIVETYYRQKTAAEAARKLGVPVGTVRSRLFYALKALGNALDEMGFES